MLEPLIVHASFIDPERSTDIKQGVSDSQLSDMLTGVRTLVKAPLLSHRSTPLNTYYYKQLFFLHI